MQHDSRVQLHGQQLLLGGAGRGSDVRKAFNVMANAVESAKGRLQIIVLDHAPREVWGDIPNIVAFEEWRDGVGGDAPGRPDAELDDLGRTGYFQTHRSAGLRRLKMIWVTDAKTLPDYRLWVRFSDNTEGEIDLKDFIASDARPVVAALRDAAMFSAIRVEMDTVVWANGFDLAPEFLYARAKAHASA